jgi:hypothetical protein
LDKVAILFTAIQFLSGYNIHKKYSSHKQISVDLIVNTANRFQSSSVN